MKLLITGGAGFIGSALVRMAYDSGHTIINVDKLTYASNLKNLDSVSSNSNYIFEHADICDAKKIRKIIKTHEPDAFIHLAAESHVDRSIDNPAEFMQTNIIGTYHLLEASLEYFEKLPSKRKAQFRFVHVSTDEVFGSLEEDDVAFNRATPYDPRSPYSSSKASSDHLARAWFHTYGLPVIISNCSNNYGPYQFPEKFVPLMILNGLSGKALPVYGKGENIRDWLHVDDHCRALLQMVKSGVAGETYLVGGDAESRNIDTVSLICHLLDELNPTNRNTSHVDLIEFVKDRPGHDLRYAIDFSETQKTLGWQPIVNFQDGLKMTVRWYLENESWWRPLLEQHGATNRSGLERVK